MADSGRRDGPAEWTLGERYRVGREIGRGSYGVVHRAVDLRSGRDVALKLIDLERDNGPEDAATEHAGAELQQRFGRVHPGFVPEVFDHGEISGYYTIAMELIEAPSLNQAMGRNGPLAADRAAGIALAIAGFLDRARRFTATQSAAASETIVHGDLKPQHIKLLPDGTIRVLDFGIAHGLSTSRTSATARGTSTHYASPELLETGRVRPQEDWWALGIMLFEMLAGVVPYHRYTLQPSLERAIRTGAPRDSLPPGTNPVLAAIVDKLLRAQPERRYPSAAAIARDLSAFLDGEPTIAESEAATVATVRTPAAAAARLPVTGFDVPTLPVPRPLAKSTVPPSTVTPSAVTPSAVSSTPAAPSAVIPVATAPAILTPPQRERMSWRRRILLILAIPLGISLLAEMCGGGRPPMPMGSGFRVGMSLPSAAAPEERDAATNIPLDMEFVRIPPGEFTMGCSPGDGQCDEDELPQHTVRITRAFEMGAFEVTTQQWSTIVGESTVEPEEAVYPARRSWFEVRDLLNGLNRRNDGFRYRLPTEAEWEYAARAGTTTPHGDNLHDMASWSAGEDKYELGWDEPNGWGLHDMLGNREEWVHDWYAPYQTGLSQDPTGPKTGEFRVLRGTCCRIEDLRVSMRSYDTPRNPRAFRLVRLPGLSRGGR